MDDGGDEMEATGVSNAGFSGRSPPLFFVFAVPTDPPPCSLPFQWPTNLRTGIRIFRSYIQTHVRTQATARLIIRTARKKFWCRDEARH